MGVMIDDGGMIFVVFNVGLDSIRFFGSCACFARGRVRIPCVAKDKGKMISFSLRGSRTGYCDLKCHDGLCNFCRSTLMCHTSQNKQSDGCLGGSGVF